jgi:glycosyltransferase involved in cell wall biosynthesis
MQVPVVVSNSPGNETLLLGEPQKPALGRIFELNDPESLASQIQQTVKNSVITSAQVEAAREYVLREADWPANIKRLGDLIASISPST